MRVHYSEIIVDILRLHHKNHTQPARPLAFIRNTLN